MNAASTSHAPRQASNAGENLLQVQGIAKSFPGVRALKGVHLNLSAGEVLAVIGENGAGKIYLDENPGWGSNP